MGLIEPDQYMRCLHVRHDQYVPKLREFPPDHYPAEYIPGSLEKASFDNSVLCLIADRLITPLASKRRLFSGPIISPLENDLFYINISQNTLIVKKYCW